jgi:hypothetical protein
MRTNVICPSQNVGVDTLRTGAVKEPSVPPHWAKFPVTVSSILPIVAKNLAVLGLEAAGCRSMDHPPPSRAAWAKISVPSIASSMSMANRVLVLAIGPAPNLIGRPA